MRKKGFLVFLIGQSDRNDLENNIILDDLNENNVFTR